MIREETVATLGSPEEFFAEPLRVRDLGTPEEFFDFVGETERETIGYS